MNKKTLITLSIIGIIAVIALVYIGIRSLNLNGDKTDNKNEIADICDLLEHPERYDDQVNVEGEVVNVDNAEKVFALSCGEACTPLPIKWEGTMPNEGDSLIVTGEVIKDEYNKYVFSALELENQ